MKEILKQKLKELKKEFPKIPYRIDKRGCRIVSKISIWWDTDQPKHSYFGGGKFQPAVIYYDKEGFRTREEWYRENWHWSPPGQDENEINYTEMSLEELEDKIRESVRDYLEEKDIGSKIEVYFFDKNKEKKLTFTKEKVEVEEK